MEMEEKHEKELDELLIAIEAERPMLILMSNGFHSHVTKVYEALHLECVLLKFCGITVRRSQDITEWELW